MQYHAIMLMFINEKIKLNKDLFCSWHVALTSQCEMRQDVTGMTPIWHPCAVHVQVAFGIDKLEQKDCDDPSLGAVTLYYAVLQLWRVS